MKNKYNANCQQQREREKSNKYQQDKEGTHTHVLFFIFACVFDKQNNEFVFLWHDYESLNHWWSGVQHIKISKLIHNYENKYRKRLNTKIYILNVNYVQFETIDDLTECEAIVIQKLSQ